MNQAVKVLIIFVTVASLSFMALTGAVTLGGPNWWGRSQDMKDYSFEATTGETTTYKVTHRLSGEPVSVPNSEIHAAAVVGALQDQERRQKARVTELDQAIAQQEGFIQTLENYQQEAVSQLEARTKEYQEQLSQLHSTIENLNAEIDKIYEQMFALNGSLGERREDVLRLRDQLALVEADRDRLAAERKELEDILVLLNASLGQLERRTRQLENQN